MSITRLSGGLTPADGADPRTFPTIFNEAADVIDDLGVGFRLVGTRYYTSSGTFDKADPFGDGSFDGALMRAVRVRLVAGGGGSGGAQLAILDFCSAGSGGGGGGYAERFYSDVSSFDSSISVTVGAGGAASDADTVAAAAGGASSFGTLSASGGAGGLDAPATDTFIARSGGAGGDSFAGSPDFTVVGGRGGGADAFTVQPGVQVYAVAGDGGSSFLSGASTAEARFGGRFFGRPGTIYGGGASGSSSGRNNNPAAVGAAGAPGIVIVEVYA